MYKIAILGCENSHANKFLNYVIKESLYPDIEIAGVWSDEPDAVKKLVDEYGVYAMTSPDEFVGKIDGLVITARRGSDHYRLAAPYIPTGIPMFIDKPITSNPREAVEFMKALKSSGVKVTGGSSLIHTEAVAELKEAITREENGACLGGFMRAPLQPNSPYDGFYFYCMHLLQSMQEVFGYYPDSVKAFVNGKVITVVVRYADYDVTLEFVDGSYIYRAVLSMNKAFICKDISVADREFKIEFERLHALLAGGKMHESYRDFIAPVFLAEAVKQSIESGEEVHLARPEEI